MTITFTSKIGHAAENAIKTTSTEYHRCVGGMTSLRAVQTNFDTMMLWAVMIVVLIGIGFASMMIGMVILLPLVGHATWHAYRDLVR